MTLTHLLEINSRLVKPQELASIGLAERIWRESGCPMGGRELIDLLERILSECRQLGILYAPIFLQRKKALHRGTWTPRASVITGRQGTTGASPNDGKCTRCGGSGYMLTLGGRSAALCLCGGWKKRSIAN